MPPTEIDKRKRDLVQIMIRFNKTVPTENGYPYIKAVIAADYKNGTFGTVDAKGVFTAGRGGYYIDQIESGDDMYSDDFKIKAGTEVRLVDMSKCVGAIVTVTKDNCTEAMQGFIVPAAFDLGIAAAPNSDGVLGAADNLKIGDYYITDLQYMTYDIFVAKIAIKTA